MAARFTIRLRKFLDRAHRYFVKGGPFEKYYALYEMVDTFLYTPADVAPTAPHVRDGLDLKRVMTYVWMAAMPCALMACWNTGYQANLAITELGLGGQTGWRGWILDLLPGFLGVYDPSNPLGSFIHGVMFFLPVYITTIAVGGIWEVTFAAIRNHEVNEGFFVTSILFALTLPPTTPLWQVALGISFGVVIGKEVFGGTGKNFLNPALTGRLFLYFSFAGSQTGDTVWIAVDGFSGATPLAMAAAGGVNAIVGSGIDWWSAFWGTIPGSLGETSTAACILGGMFLLYTGVASYRIVFGCIIGLVGSAMLLGFLNDSNPAYTVPWYWHLVIGSFAFGTVYMATDPVSAAMTNTGRWLYGIFIGCMTILIRVVNPAFPEGVMFAILLGNLVAPIIDHFVVRANIRRRQRRGSLKA